MDLLQYEFMQRAFIGGIIVSLSCALVGVFITLRKESFISEAVAHSSLAGVALAFLISIEPLYFALLVGVITAVGITFIQKRSRISSDSVIGIFFSLIFAIGIIILSFVKGYRPELTTFLFGSILSVNYTNILLAFIILLFGGFFIFRFLEKLLYISFDPESAKIRGLDVVFFEYAIRILSALVIISSIKVVGIVLVTALIVIPASSAKLFARNFKQMFPLTIFFSFLSVVLGLLTSYYVDIPSGATIVVITALLFALALGIKKSTITLK